MDLDGLELPEPCPQGCSWLQESWEAAGVRIGVPDTNGDVAMQAGEAPIPPDA